MPRLLHPMIAIGAVLIFTSQLAAQAPGNSTIRPSTDFGVTTGIGTGSSFKNVPPSVDQPPPARSGALIWDTPEANEKPEKGEVKEPEANGKAAPRPPEVVENPRTTITRDRIESPQHR